MKNYTIDNKTRSISGWAQKAGISRQAMQRRLKVAKTEEELRAAVSPVKRPGFRTDLHKA